jgi:hypothetical protein
MEKIWIWSKFLQTDDDRRKEEERKSGPCSGLRGTPSGKGERYVRIDII